MNVKELCDKLERLSLFKKIAVSSVLAVSVSAVGIETVEYSKGLNVDAFNGLSGKAQVLSIRDGNAKYVCAGQFVKPRTVEELNVVKADNGCSLTL